jgi:transcriptional regulator with XRE-family HTH domain
MKTENLQYKHIDTHISAGIVRRLQKEGMTLKDIGEKMGGLSHSFISQVKNGNRGFTMARLLMLEDEIDRPLPIIILQGAEEIWGPEKLKEPYKILQQWLNKSAEMRKRWKI